MLGHVNDVAALSRADRLGVSEYLVLPLERRRPSSARSPSSSARRAPTRSAAPSRFVGAKGGVGASTVAHNVAWAIARQLDAQDVLILDLDLAFGTAGLNFNQDPPHGIADAVFAPDRLDPTMLDRLMTKAANHLNLLTAPVTLDRIYDFDEDATSSRSSSILRANVPLVDPRHSACLDRLGRGTR